MLLAVQIILSANIKNYHQIDAASWLYNGSATKLYLSQNAHWLTIQIISMTLASLILTLSISKSCGTKQRSLTFTFGNLMILFFMCNLKCA